MTLAYRGVSEVLFGERKWEAVTDDCLFFLRRLPDDCVDMCFFSPPYENRRDYGIGFDLKGQSWCNWLEQIWLELNRVCTGLVACVCQGPVKNFRWSATPAMLIVDLARLGLNVREPMIFERKGIMGTGKDDGNRNYEWIVRTSRPGRLPWADPTAMGHPPLYEPGGPPTYRLKDGSRVKGDYVPPELVNPGNIVRCAVGKGHMGHDLAHENEAPFPVKLAEHFVRSWCKPDGVVLDPFCGSGTTGHAAVEWHRRFIGCDIRPGQVRITKLRLGQITPMLYPAK